MYVGTTSATYAVRSKRAHDFEPSARLFELMDEPNVPSDAEDARVLDVADGNVALKNVAFSYTPEQDLIRDLTLEVKAGQKIAIVGATGSGKTTLLSLLMRFYQVPVGSGTIRIGGRDIRTMTPDELRSRFGVAMQNDFLYSDTVEENIKFGREISHGDVVRAAKIAQADDFISYLADGYDHVISPKGTNLSGGQRQRLTIARALVANPEILILDDSASALDFATDAALRSAIRNMDGDTTVFIVSQRASSIMHADKIIVLDDGEMAGLGTHEELLEVCPEYKEISDSQMGGAFVE